MAKAFSEVLAINEATELKRDDIFLITQDGASAGIRSNVIEATINATLIRSQDDFNNIIERIAANQYKIKDGIYSIYVKRLTGGYKMHGGTSPLSGGDGWGYLQTNECYKIEFEPGAYIDAGQTQFYIELNSTVSLNKYISIRGDKGGAASIAKAFLLNADYVNIENCETRSRYSDATFTVFEGSATASHNKTAQVTGCKVLDCDIDNNQSLIGFRYFYTVSQCYINDIDLLSGLGILYGFRDITNVSDCIITELTVTDSGIIRGLEDCFNVNNIYMDTFTCNNGSIVVSEIRGIINCENVDNIITKNFVANTTAVPIWPIGGTNITNCIVDVITSTGAIIGIAGNFITNCKITNISPTNSIGYGGDYIDSCYVDGALYGFSGVNRADKCFAENCASHGFRDSNVLSKCRSINNGGFGFDNCKPIDHCQSTGNTSGNYSATCYADWAGTIAVADTATGGYNG